MEWRKTSTNRSDAIVMVEELIVALTQLHLNNVAEVVRLGECRTGQWHPFLYRFKCCDMTKMKWNVVFYGNYICLIVPTFWAAMLFYENNSIVNRTGTISCSTALSISI